MLLALIAACVGEDPTPSVAPDADAGGADAVSSADGSGNPTPPDGSPADGGDGSAPANGILSGTVDSTFKGGVIALDGVTSGAELVSISCLKNDQLLGVVHVHTGTTHSWYFVLFAPDGSILGQANVGNGEPTDAVVGTDDRLYVVGVLDGFGSLSVFPFFNQPNPTTASFSVNLGGLFPARVSYSNDHVYAVALSSTTGVEILRFDRGGQQTGYTNDAGAVVVVAGSVNARTPRPTLGVLGDDAYAEGLLSNGTTLGASGVHLDAKTFSFLNGLVQRGITLPVDLAPAGASALATAGMVDPDAGTSAIARVWADGGADTTYGGALSALAASALRPGRIQMGPDGFLLVASAPGAASTTTVAALSRLRPDGTFDTSFGSNGVVAVSGAATSPAVRGICWQAGHQRAIIGGTDHAGSDAAKVVLAAIK